MSKLLYHSVMKYARTKIIFGGVSTEDLEVLVREVAIDQLDPWKVKDELRTLEQEAHETTREVVSVAESASQTLTRGIEHSRGRSQTDTDGQEWSQGNTLGYSAETGASESDGETDTDSLAKASSYGNARTVGRTVSSGESSQDNMITTFSQALPPGEFVSLGGFNTTRTSTQARGYGSSRSTAVSEFTSHSDIWGETETKTVGRAGTKTRGKHNTLGHNAATSQNKGRSKNHSQGRQEGEGNSLSAGITGGKTMTKTVTPFHEYHKRYVVSSRQFLTLEEQLTLIIQKIKALPKACFLLKTPRHQAALLRALFLKTPWISERRLTEAMARIHEQPYYATPQQIAAEEQERSQRLAQLAARALPVPEKAPRIKRHSGQSKTKPDTTPWDLFDYLDNSDNEQ